MYPYAVAYMAGEGLCVFPLHIADAYLRVVLAGTPSRTVLQVNQYGSRVGIVIGLAVESHARRGGQFNLYVRFFQKDTVVARYG